MAYRAIHTKIWRDTWFADLEPDSKLLFFYLCSNEATNVLGLYELSPKIAAFETGLGLEQVKLCLSEFRAAGKVDMENGWIWVKNLMRYNATNLASPDVQTHIRKTLALVPDGRLKTACTAYNTLPTPSIHPVETVPPPSPDGPPTVQYTVQDQNNTVQDQNTESGETPDNGPTAPVLTFSGWTSKLQASQNRSAVLREAFEALYPGRDPPDFSYLGKVSREVGGAGRLMELLWQHSTRPPAGDILAYCLKAHRNGGKQGRIDVPEMTRGGAEKWGFET